MGEGLTGGILDGEAVVAAFREFRKEREEIGCIPLWRRALVARYYSHLISKGSMTYMTWKQIIDRFGGITPKAFSAESKTPNRKSIDVIKDVFYVIIVLKKIPGNREKKLNFLEQKYTGTPGNRDNRLGSALNVSRCPIVPVVPVHIMTPGHYFGFV